MSKVYIPKQHHFDRSADLLVERAEDAPGDLLTTRQVADWFQVSLQWLQIGRSRGYGPPFVRIGRRVRYPKGASVQYLKARLYQSTAEYTSETEAADQL